MNLIKIFIFGSIASICMHFIASNLWKEKKVPDILLKFKWIIFIIYFMMLYLIEDYSNLLYEYTYPIMLVNLFLSYTFISALRNK